METKCIQIRPVWRIWEEERSRWGGNKKQHHILEFSKIVYLILNIMCHNQSVNGGPSSLPEHEHRFILTKH